jgi:hypothetical protein
VREALLDYQPLRGLSDDLQLAPQFVQCYRSRSKTTAKEKNRMKPHERLLPRFGD